MRKKTGNNNNVQDVSLDFNNISSIPYVPEKWLVNFDFSKWKYKYQFLS